MMLGDVEILVSEEVDELDPGKAWVTFGFSSVVPTASPFGDEVLACQATFCTTGTCRFLLVTLNLGSRTDMATIS